MRYERYVFCVDRSKKKLHHIRVIKEEVKETLCSLIAIEDVEDAITLDRLYANSTCKDCSILYRNQVIF